MRDRRAFGAAGVDEAGRGALAGPVVAAAVILGPPLEGVDDSKRLSPARRERLAKLIRAHARCWALGQAGVDEITCLNVLHASLLAMARAVAALSVAPGRVLVDGLHCPRLDCPVTAVVGGDRTVPAIGAASILAKVERDRIMTELDCRYPAYGFGRHKGYATAEHVAALHEHGVSPVHRVGYAPVREAAQGRLL